MKLLSGLLICVFLAAPSLAADKPRKTPKQYQQLLAMTPEQFKASATLKDDALETAATITTEKGWQQKDGLLKLVNSDEFFRAFIDKKTGETKFQVYKYVRYYGGGWAFFDVVNYETPNGPVQSDLTIIGRDVGSCSQVLGCLHVETVGFEVPEDLLRTVARKYAPDSTVIWRFRLKAKSGVQRDEGFVAAEVAGILAAVDEYKRSHGLTGPVLQKP